MKNLSKKMETIFSAITFAEEGEFEIARQILEENSESKKPVIKSQQKDIHIQVIATES